MSFILSRRFFFCLFCLFFIQCGRVGSAKLKKMPDHLNKATFAGGCFWCMQPPFDYLKGVIHTRVGYTGGHKENPTYEEICLGNTGHTEAVEIVYDPGKISYVELLDVFWRNIDPTQADGQFADRGTQYRTAIFYHNEEQKKSAKESKEKLAKLRKFKKPIITEIEAAVKFYAAEEYHQEYYKKSPLRYNAYKKGSGRADYIEKNREDSSKQGKE